jgi:hypothetical protein
MATLTLKNTSVVEIVVDDVGAVIPALGQDTYATLALIRGLAASQAVRALVAAGTLVVNDGAADLPVVEGLGYLDSLWASAGTGQIAPLPPGFIHNARLNWDTVQDVSIGTVGALSVVKDSRAARDIFWKGQLSARMIVSGPGGLQTGSVEAANTWYRVLVIADSTGVNPPAGLLVPDGTAFSQAGYDVFRRVGYVRNNAGSNFLKFFQAGDGNERFIFYDEAAGALAMLVNGNALAFADVSLASVVPPIGRATVFLGVAFENAGGGGAATDELLLRPKGSTVAAPVIRMAPGIVLTQKQKQNLLMFVDAAQTLQYQVSANADAADIAVVGYYDEL